MQKLKDAANSEDAANTDIMNYVDTLSIDIAADTWCHSKGLWYANNRAVYVNYEDTVSGGHSGQTCQDICTNSFPDTEGQNWDESHEWDCVSGQVRIAPDYGQLDSNSGHWGSHYWQYDCDHEINSTNGDTYCCCGQAGAEDEMQNLKDAVNNDIEDQIQTATNDVMAYVETLQVDVAADSWCQSKGLWSQNNRAVYVSYEMTTSGGHPGQTCHDICVTAFPDYEGQNWDEGHEWDCVSGQIRIAPDYGQLDTNTGHWASHYWHYDCDHTIASTNGDTYCCCGQSGATDKMSELEALIGR